MLAQLSHIRNWIFDLDNTLYPVSANLFPMIDARIGCYVADLLSMAHIRVLEIATFYTMFNLTPVGRWHVQLCGTTPCLLRGGGDLKTICP